MTDLASVEDEPELRWTCLHTLAQDRDSGLRNRGRGRGGCGVICYIAGHPQSGLPVDQDDLLLPQSWILVRPPTKCSIGMVYKQNLSCQEKCFSLLSSGYMLVTARPWNIYPGLRAESITIGKYPKCITLYNMKKVPRTTLRSRLAEHLFSIKAHISPHHLAAEIGRWSFTSASICI